jgi:hypothetical protein
LVIYPGFEKRATLYKNLQLEIEIFVARSGVGMFGWQG